MIRSVVFFSDLTPNIRLAAIDRLAQLSTNGFQRLEVTIATLASIFNWPQRVRFDDAQEMADFLLEEALLSPYYEKWEALVLSFKQSTIFHKTNLRNPFLYSCGLWMLVQSEAMEFYAVKLRGTYSQLQLSFKD